MPYQSTWSCGRFPVRYDGSGLWEVCDVHDVDVLDGGRQMSWYLQSADQHGTHRGTLARGNVIAVCGIQFRPLPVAPGRTALRGSPRDPDQICPACQAEDIE